MDHDAVLETALNRARRLPTQSQDVQLRLYGLYKQATQGDAGDDRPGMFDLVGRAKFDAWSRCRGMSRTDAARAYTELVDDLSDELAS